MMLGVNTITWRFTSAAAATEESKAGFLSRVFRRTDGATDGKAPAFMGYGLRPCNSRYRPGTRAYVSSTEIHMEHWWILGPRGSRL